MSPLADAALDRLRRAVAEPDLGGTRYQLIGLLGRGGMATVYRVRDTALDREVALKILDLPGSDELAGRLEREARVLARLEHPGIVPVHDVGTLADGRTFCVMKRIAGRRLDEAVEGVALAERLRLFLRVCEAVAFAHAQGIVHRDLKPQNVMIGPFGEVLVVDWGLAKALGEREVETAAAGGAGSAPVEGETRDGVVLGTPGYMAPEQRQGRSGEADRRSDVYSLGALLHALIAGRPPGDEPALPTRTAKALAAICRRALAVTPAARYADAGELAADLERFLDGRPVAARRETSWERIERVFLRYRTAILLILAYLLMRTLLLLFGRP